MKRRVYFFSWLDQRGVWSYKSTLISRKSFLASGISLNLGEVQVKICERSLQVLLSSPPPPTPPPPGPLAPAYLTRVTPFCSPKWRAWRTKITLPLPLNGVWVRKCRHVQGCQLSRIMQRILHCSSYLTVNIKGFLINSGMPFLSICFIANSCWLESTSIFCTNDVTCHTIPGYPIDNQ